VEHREALPQCHAPLVGHGQPPGDRERRPVALAHPHALERHHRAADEPADLRHHPGDALPVTHGHDHRRHRAIRADEAGAPATAGDGAVHADERGRSGHSAPVQQPAHGDVGRPPPAPLTAPHVDGELGRIPELVGKGDGTGGPGEHAHPLEGDQPRAAEDRGAIEQRLDAVGGVDGHGDHRQVLRQGERRIAPQVVGQAESRRAAQEDARRHPVRRVQIHQGVGDEPPADPPPLTDVTGDDEAVRVHRWTPTARPRAAASTPHTSGTTMFRASAPMARSSARRCVSNIQVENVV